MRWQAAIENILTHDEPLDKRTSFQIGGRADYFLQPGDASAFAAAYAAASRSGLPIYILGGGTNLLISDEGIRGIVIRVPENGGTARVTGHNIMASAAMSLPALVKTGVQAGLGGLERLAGIPGTVGGAVKMNAGGRYGFIGDFVETVWCVDCMGRVLPRKGREIRWGYRSTSIDAPIMAVEFTLRAERQLMLERRMKEILEEKQSSQPMNQRSAGCFFRNPPGGSAGQLIEAAGLKGSRRGEACVSEKHANFIVNLGAAKASDVLALADDVRGGVQKEFGVSLEMEVCRWPDGK